MLLSPLGCADSPGCSLPRSRSLQPRCVACGELGEGASGQWVRPFACGGAHAGMTLLIMTLSGAT